MHHRNRFTWHEVHPVAHEHRPRISPRHGKRLDASRFDQDKLHAPGFAYRTASKSSRARASPPYSPVRCSYAQICSLCFQITAPSAPLRLACGPLTISPRYCASFLAEKATTRPRVVHLLQEQIAMIARTPPAHQPDENTGKTDAPARIAHERSRRFVRSITSRSVRPTQSHEPSSAASSTRAAPY